MRSAPVETIDRGRTDKPLGGPSMEIEPTRLTKAQARKLTDRIAAHLVDAWAELEQAAAGRAWESLGYSGWGEYVRAEFGMTPGHSGRLLGQAEVVRALEAAAGVDLPRGAVSARAAGEIRPVLGEVVQEVREAVRGRHESTRAAVVGEVVSESRARARSAPSVPDQTPSLAKVATPRAPAEKGWETCPTCDGEGRVRRDREGRVRTTPRPDAKAKPALRKDGRCEHGFDLATQFCRECEG